MVVTWEIPETTPTDYRISWAQSSLSFPSYNDSNGPEKGNLSPLGSETTLTLDNLTPGVDYKIKMRARYYNEDRSEHLSSGPWTDTMTQRVKDQPPAAPTGLTASDIEHDSLTLTWTDPQDERITGYRILRGASANSLSTIEEDTEGTSTEYEDETVSPETTYHYAVLALSQDGNSVQSGAISATTPAAPSSGEQDEPRETPKKEDPPEPVGPRQVDNTAPTVSSAQTSTDGSQIEITLSETLASTNPPHTSSFEVTTDGEPHATSGTVTFSTAVASFTVTPSISQGQAVVVKYTDPTTNNDVARVLQDASGNDVATFTTGVAGVPAVTNRSTTAATASGAPTSLTARANGSSRIDLSWTAPADNGGRVITGYKVEVSSDGGNAWTDRVANTGDNNRTYAHTGLAPNSTRHYRVSAINSIGTSSASNVDNATTNNPPTGMNGAITVDEDKIFYFWFRPSLFGYFDPNGKSMASFTITEMPARGALTMSGAPINNVPFRIHRNSVENRGRSLRYKPAPNGHGTPYATFKFKVSDGTEDSTASSSRSATAQRAPLNTP